ncbi:MAG TPA: YdeI/OmpD-associated family protein, partial [Vicinamibacterales bacterium]|nr:YdeI/OmpD-associated family protein [Vicinamibacterales bacterium]
MAANHAREDELWLKIHKKASGLPSVTTAQALDVALCWGWIDGIRKSFDERSFLQRYTPRRARSMWSQVNRDHVARLTKAGRMTAHGQRQIDAAKKDGRWDAAYAPIRSASAATVPADLRAAIDADPRAKKTFATLNRQNLFALTFRTNNMKTPAGRASKIAALVAKLAKGQIIVGLVGVLLLCALPSSALAQRQLHWARLDVAAHLNADGTLTVTETQTMVFTGDWNGGERRFRLEPRQQVAVTGVSRDVGGTWRQLQADSSLDDVDEYAMTDARTLRWRSRRPEDPPFAGTPLRYQIVYVLSGILLKENDSYRLDNDFVFPNRDGSIEHFELKLTLDPVWQPSAPVEPVYSAGPLAPGKSFVVNLPLRYSGAGAPTARDTKRPREIVIAVTLVLGVTVLAIVAMLLREQRYGRFAPLATNIDDAWIREHILKYPAEVVAAAWDENVGTAEVVALIARLVADGKLESSVGKGKKSDASMTLRLKADRSKLNAHERALIDKLF